jgi:hypothetical protein
MNRRIATVGMIVAVAAVGCGGADESGESGTPYGVEEADSARQTFTVRLDRATMAENIIPQIVAAARGQLAPMCEEHPGASLHIMNPHASEAYQDVPCTSVLGGDGATGEVSAALVSDEADGPIGTVQQKLSPFTLACGLLVGGAGLFATYALCPAAKTPESARNCGYVTNGGLFATGIMCAFM